MLPAKGRGFSGGLRALSSAIAPGIITICPAASTAGALQMCCGKPRVSC
jgi:hypothetical protein